MAAQALEVATIGGGCFWCIEAVFSPLQGIEKIVSGYAGGHKPDPTYKEVCTGTTGHAEVVQLTFDPAVIPFNDVLEIFFAMHDPTTLNRQGGDIGTQYRSGIFCTDDRQLEVATAVRDGYQADLERAGFGEVTTAIEPAGPFYYAEPEHQQYLDRIPNGYCGLAGTGVACRADRAANR